ncbi:Phage portal protein, lambda family [compost metagenome]
MSAVQVYADTEALLGGAVPAGPLAIGGAYEGASRTNRELAMWSPAIMSADKEIIPDKLQLDARNRDMHRNDAYVQGGVTLHQDNIVGAAYLLNSKPSFKVLGLDEKWAEEFQQEVEEKFTLYAESPNNWMDAARQNTFTELVRLAVGVHTVGGEVLATAEWLRDAWRPYSTALQMVDTDRLSTPMGEVEGPRMRGGVERNRFGAPQAYHIRLAHPNDLAFANGDAFLWKRVPIRKPWGRMQVIHLFEQTRPDQSRGVAAMVAALKEMRITKKFRDITLQSAVVNATYAASIESDLPSEAVYAALGGGNVNAQAINDYATSYLGAVAQYVGNAKNMHIDGVKIPHFFPGTRLQLRNAGTPGGVGTGFEESLLRYIAANLGVSYEELSRDYTKTNYSSARAAMNNTWKHMQARKKFTADKFATHGFRLWLEEALNFNRISSAPRNWAELWYSNAEFADAFSACEWIGANRGQIDELKETQAAVLRLKYNLTTQEDELGRLGKDWRRVFAQRKRETEMAEEYGLVAQEDNSINAASGSPQERQAKGEKDDGSEDNTDA